MASAHPGGDDDPPARPNDYDLIARSYSAENESNAWNAHYERPAVLRLLGDVRGCEVLDAGCGAGAHALVLVQRGARVTGVDSSRGMLGIAARRLGSRAHLVCADLAQPLPLADASYDRVLASLVMHYLADWGSTLGEFRRVLRGGGSLVISTHHPFMDHSLSGAESYLATYAFSECWTRGEQTIPMRFWHRPLSAMTAAIRSAGFAIEAIEEPLPDPIVRDLDPRAWQSLSTQPRFIFFLVR